MVADSVGCGVFVTSGTGGIPTGSTSTSIGVATWALASFLSGATLSTSKRSDEATHEEPLRLMTIERTFPIVEYLGSYDGDTHSLLLDLGFKITYTIQCRLEGSDTPEIRGGNQLTRNAAALARDEAAKFFAGGKGVFHCSSWGGKYGRPVGDIYVEGQSLAYYLVLNRLAVAYDGSSKRSDLMVLHRENAEWLYQQGRIRRNK